MGLDMDKEILMARGMAQGDRLAKFRRVTDLFEEGRIVVLDPNPEDPVVVWVNKINPFELDEARKDGAVGRARAVLALDEAGSPESDVFLQAMALRSTEQMVLSLVNAKQNEHYVRALDDIRADEAWAEKVLLLERGDAQLDDAGVDLGDDERSRLAKLNEEYIAEVQRLLAVSQDGYRDEIKALPETELQELFREGYRDSVGGGAFLVEYRTTETYFALRNCDAVPFPDGGWDHKGCDHTQRLCEYRAQVRDLPEGLLTKVRNAITDLSMTPRDAGNLDAPASSSASSEPRSEQAESTPSTPGEK